MEKQGVMKEIRLDIQSELTMNIVNYLLVEENYIYVGNEKEIWLENLSHPTVQLIYINQRSLFNEMQASQLMKQIDRVRSRVRRRYLLWRLNVVILNIDTASCQYFSNVKDYVKIIDIQRADDFTQNEDIKQFYSSIERASLERSMSELIIEMQQTSKAKALNVRKMLEFQSKSFVIIGFLALLVILFLMIQIQPVKNIGTAIEFGAKYNPLIIAGEYWRLLTPSLIHLQLFHLLFNAIFIYQFGKIIEHLFGWWRLTIIIIGSAFLGNLFSFAFIENVSLGASTVAYGLLGAMLFLGIENRKMFMHLVKGMIFPIMLFSIVWAIIDPTIDFYGHLGGFLGGFLIASILGLPKTKQYLSRTALATATYVLLVMGLFTRGTLLTQQMDYSDYNMALIYYYLQNNEPEKAAHFIDKLDIKLEEIVK